MFMQKKKKYAGTSESFSKICMSTSKKLFHAVLNLYFCKRTVKGIIFSLTFFYAN